MRIGIFTHYFFHDVRESARRIRRFGFQTVQLTLPPSGIARTQEARWEWFSQARDVFTGEGLGIAAISGYVNLMAPHPEKRRQARAHLHALLREACRLGSPYVVTETGTRHPDDDWAPHADNLRPETYDLLVESLGEAASVARDHGATLLLEPSVGNVIDTPSKAARLLRDVDSRAIGFVADPANYVDGGNFEAGNQLLDALFAEIGPAIRLAHAKDVRKVDGNARERHFHATDPALYGGIEYPAAGLGDLDYDRYVALLHRHCPDVSIILEHLDESDVPRAKAFMEQKLSASGSTHLD
jgi:sugar phosphate isomerase/epimerase